MHEIGISAVARFYAVQLSPAVGRRVVPLSEGAISGSEDWVRDPYAYDQAVKAVHTILEAFRPKGKIKVHPVYDFAQLPPAALENLGEGFAQSLLQQLKQPNQEAREVEIVAAIVQRIADLIPKMRVEVTPK